jgi:tetratricopeptide (TPR) repeat protein
MKLTTSQLLEQGISFLNKANFRKAENCYRAILEFQPNHYDAYHFLGITLNELGRLNEAEASYKNAIKFKPDFAEAYYNLGVTLVKSEKLEDGIKNYKNAIKFKPDFALAHNNLGNVLKELKRLDEAEVSYKNAIKFKPDFALAHNNLGNVLKELKRLDEAEVSYKNAIKFKPDFAETYFNLGNLYRNIGKLNESELNYKKALLLKHNYIEASSNIKIVLKLKKLLFSVEKARKEKILNSTNLKVVNSIIQLSPRPFIINRLVETNLIKHLYKLSFRKLDETNDSRFGNGKCSMDFNLFEENDNIINSISKNLNDIMCKAVGSKIHIMDSFFNILGAGGGTKPHNHLIPFDRMNAIGNQKYSLVYYLSVGDQNCDEPGILKLYNPDEEILPLEGMIVILPSNRKHSAIYNGKKDRIMIGVNFYSL